MGKAGGFGRVGRKGRRRRAGTGLTYLSTILGRTFEKRRRRTSDSRKIAAANSGLFQIVYALGKASRLEEKEHLDREINFTPTLRERVGLHIYGERWASHLKQYLLENRLHERPLHIISANMHSIVNCLYASAALGKGPAKKPISTNWL
jgi:hypothetical protein